MIRFLSLRNSADTLKIGFNLSDISAEITDKWGQATPQNSDATTYFYTPEAHGIGQIRITPCTDSVTLDTSAKILGDNYREGIHLGTLEQYTDAINATGVIQVHPETLYNANVYRIDANQSIEVPQSPKEVVEAMKLLDVQKGYHFSHHPGGQVITRKAKSRNDRLVAYSKRDELLRASNKEFIEAHPKVLASFTDNTLRIEYQIRKLADMRKVYNTSDITLGGLLGADVNPVSNIYRTVSKDYNKLIEKYIPMAQEAEGYTLSRVKDMLMVRQCNYNLALIMQVVRMAGIKGNLSPYRTKFRRLISEMRTKESEEKGHRGIIHMVDNLLLQAEA